MATQDRRQGYRIAVKLLSYLALAAIGFVFIASLFSSVNNASSLRIDFSGLAQGEIAFHEWNRRKVLVLRRTPEMLALLESNTEWLYDPQSKFSQQPKGMDNPYRSIKPDIFVAVAAGTDLNCEVELILITEQAEEGGQYRSGGFRDRCRGSHYDYAGRVLKGQMAKRNLLVPDYTFESDSALVIPGD